MATITPTNVSTYGAQAVTVTTLTGTDTFTYDESKDPTLILHNPTAGALTPVIDGDGATTVGVAGAGTFDISGGYSVGSVAAGETVAIRLRTIRQYLAGVISMSGTTGIEAQLLER